MKAFLSLILNNIILEIENKEDNYLCLDLDQILNSSLEKKEYLKFKEDKSKAITFKTQIR